MAACGTVSEVQDDEIASLASKKSEYLRNSEFIQKVKEKNENRKFYFHCSASQRQS